ncbi:MAG: hypothetical protein HZB76_03835 [Chlamydiae bacterium]|nr:hypothetical protein [Chlamydiota bacterium]
MKKGFKISKTFLILVIIALFIFFLPSIVSLGGKSILINLIAKKQNAKISLERLELSWLGPQTLKGLKYQDKNLDLDFESMTSNISLFSLSLILKNVDKATTFLTHTQIKNGNVKLHFPNEASTEFSNINLLAQTKGTDGALNLSIQGKTAFEKALGSFDISLDKENSKWQSNIVCKQLPVKGIDEIVSFYYPKFNECLISILGSLLDLNFHSELTDLQGPFSITLTSTNGKADVIGNFNKNNITLTSDAFLSFTIDGSSNSMLSSIKSESAIALKIDAADFFIPLKSFDLQNLKVGHAYLDLGKMKVPTKGPIAQITKIMKQGSSKMADLWFTGVNLKLENGILFTDRMDELINNSLHVCTWGNVNIINKQLRMYLGLTADTLSSVFGLNDLPDDYVIKVPITGTLDKMKVDASGASAKIVALSALKSKTGIAGLIGGVLTHVDRDTDIPSPKLPYPWEGKVKKPSKAKTKVPDIFKLF